MGGNWERNAAYEFKEYAFKDVLSESASIGKS